MGSAAAAVRPRSVTIVLAAAAALGVFAFGAAFVLMAGLSKPSCCSFRLFCAMFPCVCSSYSLLGSSSSAGTTAIAASPIVAVRIAVRNGRSFDLTLLKPSFETVGFLFSCYPLFVFMLSSFCFHAILTTLVHMAPWLREITKDEWKNIRRLESAQQSPHPPALRTILPRRLGGGAAVFTQILCHTKSHGRSIRRYRALPALPGGSPQRGRYLRVPRAG